MDVEETVTEGGGRRGGQDQSDQGDDEQRRYGARRRARPAAQARSVARVKRNRFLVAGAWAAYGVGGPGTGSTTASRSPREAYGFMVGIEL
jgi:hypothetical protein